ncbi:phosphatase PAP2 family protein [Streptomyces sp. NPDC002004]
MAVRGPLLRADERLDHRLVGRAPGTPTQLLSDLGSLPVALPVLGAAVGYAVWRGGRAAPLAVALTMAVVPALVVPVKEWTARPGPLTAETGYFPSGHTATATVAYVGASLLLAPYVRRSWPLYAAAGSLVLATGAGLVLHGYHWPLDVVGSWCLCGTLLSGLGMLRIGSAPRVRPRPPRDVR